jgi:hypothetical protein
MSDSESKSPVIDPDALDSRTLAFLGATRSKVAAMHHMVEVSVSQAAAKGLIVCNPPSLAHIYCLLRSGGAAFNDAQRTSVVQYPFPYAQATTMMTMLHVIVTPYFIACTARGHVQAFFFTFVLVFALIALYQVAIQLEEPFGDDDNDLDMLWYQEEFNRSLHIFLEYFEVQGPSLDDSVGMARLDGQAKTHLPCLTAKSMRSRRKTLFFQEKDSDDDENDDEDESDTRDLKRLTA